MAIVAEGVIQPQIRLAFQAFALPHPRLCLGLGPQDVGHRRVQRPALGFGGGNTFFALGRQVRFGGQRQGIFVNLDRHMVGVMLEPGLTAVRALNITTLGRNNLVRDLVLRIAIWTY